VPGDTPLANFPDSVSKQTAPLRLFVDRPGADRKYHLVLDPVPPEQPIAPRILPSSINGIPRREVITSSSVVMYTTPF
jgi:hypothetical protein